MTVRTRLLTTLAVVTAVLAAPAFFAIARLAAVRDIASELGVQHATAFIALGRLQTGLARVDRLQRSYLASGDPEHRARVDESLAAAQRSVGDLETAGYGDFAGRAGVLLDSILAATLHIAGLLAGGRQEDATTFFEEVKPLFVRADSTLDRMARAIDRRSAADVAEAQRISLTATRTAVMALILALLAALLIGGSTTGRLSALLRRLRSAMAAVAGGSFTTPEELPYARADEIGDLARSFRSMTHRLAELDRVKAEFVSFASHELKTPINVIGGYAELLEDGVYGPTTDQQRSVLSAVREQTQVLARLVNQLLDVSRIEAGGLRLEPDSIEARPFFAGIERAFEALATRNDIDFGVEIEDSVPDEFWGDADRLRNEGLGNLLSNAFKFTARGGRIRVRAWASPLAIHIEVADSGIGIPSDQLPHIFDKYYQVGSQARSIGSGLGLAIAREVFAGHGGTITATSEPGVGTTFRVTLPVRHAATSAAV
jgi:signal transduction histidine kinase